MTAAGGSEIDEHLRSRVLSWQHDPADLTRSSDQSASIEDVDRLRAGFAAQLASRHLDFAARWLQQRGAGYYTIGSAGHESNAFVALALRPTDPALLHYRSGGFYAARAGQVPGSTPIADVLDGLAAAVADPISGGRHKVFGNRDLAIIPQTSTIASHLPRAFGLALALRRARSLELESPWPSDAIVVASFGDASVNHSTAVGAINAAAYCAARGIALPLLLVCEDNGLGISTPTPAGWVEQALGHWPGIRYLSADGTRPAELLRVADDAARSVRAGEGPVALHLRTVRFLGHAGSDVELGYRTSSDLRRDLEQDPLIATAATLVRLGAATPDELLDEYDATGRRVLAEAETRLDARRLGSADEVMAPLVRPVSRTPAAAPAPGSDGSSRALTLAATINAVLADVLARDRSALVLGEDVAVKGGVYGVTRGLRRRFGGHRVFDTILDEQTILGTALGAALAGQLPIPEIQYLAYLHNAEDQLRGEAASLAFFSNGQYANGMVVRIAGLGYQKGFGGHFHNDNSVAVLRDIPGLVLAVPSHPAEAAALLHRCVRLAAEEGRVCVFLEPIALYHERDLQPGDDRWLAAYRSDDEPAAFGTVSVTGDGEDLLLVTFGNGVRMSLRAAERLAANGIRATVLDLRWLAPLPAAELARWARAYQRVLVVDETRAAGGVAEGVMAALSDAGYGGTLRRVTSKDSYLPLGPAAAHVLLSEDDIVEAALAIMGGAGFGG